MSSSSSRSNVIWDRTDLFTFSKSLILGSLFILWLRGEERAKPYEERSRIQIAIDPLIQSRLRWILSIPVILLGLLLSYDHGISWTNPSISPNVPEWGWVKPKSV